MPSNRPSATSQPSLFSHSHNVKYLHLHLQLHCTTSTATKTDPYICPITTSALALSQLSTAGRGGRGRFEGEGVGAKTSTVGQFLEGWGGESEGQAAVCQYQLGGRTYTHGLTKFNPACMYVVPPAHSVQALRS